MSRFTSRKFLTAAAGLIAGIVVIFGVDEGIVSTVSGAVVSLASLVTYIVTEGAVDKADTAGASKDVKTK